jgi:hypothetical protein
LIINGSENEYGAVNEMHLIINGAYKPTPNSESFMELEAIDACAGDDVSIACNPGNPEDCLVPDYQVFWSDTSIWPDQRLPRKGESVTIGCWNLVLDIEQTPILELVTIYGRLTFSDEMDVHLRAKHINVRNGEFYIGNVSEPY